MSDKRKRVEPTACLVLSAPEQAFLNSLPENESAAIIGELGAMNAIQPKMPIRFRILSSNLPSAVKQDALSRVLQDVSPKYMGWLETVLSMPFGKTLGPLARTPRMRRRTLLSAKKAMDAAVVGHSTAKDSVLMALSQSMCSKGATPAIGLGGPPGIGKTTFAQHAMRVLGRPVVFISLGGCFDSAFLTGHSYTYEGATCGRIADAMREAGCMNPVIYFDELDKVSATPRGAEIMNTLIHLTDPSQNSKFRDKYLGVDMDLSEVTYVFSYNDASCVCPILLDRITRIDCSAPTADEKVRIARLHLIPRCLKKHGLVKPPQLSDATLRHLIARHTQSEKGVRNLERCIDSVYGVYSVWNIDPDVLAEQHRFESSSELSEAAVDRILGSTREEPNPSALFMYA